MRPSLTTLAGMTLAAGSIALAGAGLVGTSTASAQVEPAPVDLGVVAYVLEPAELEPLVAELVGGSPDAEVEFVNAPDEEYSWLDGDDGCPPCGMG